MKRKIATAYAIFLTVLLVAGCIGIFCFAWIAKGNMPIIQSLYSFVASFILAPLVHELGHVALAAANRMDCIYVKCFCGCVSLKNGKKRFSLASPFAPDQTQVIPKVGGNMKKRASAYTVGGLLFSGIFILCILAAAIVCTCLGVTRFDLWGLLPYFLYLFLLNVAPFEYKSGKTDMLVYHGLRTGGAAEQNMLAAMEIHGQLYSGKSFSEIEEENYFNVPQLCEDEPLFAVMLDLRYRYYIEKEEFDEAAACLNRLMQIQEYLPEEEVVRIAAEVTYMHSINGDVVRAEETGNFCHEYLTEENVTSKRVLMAYSLAGGNVNAIEPLREQAKELLSQERIAGVRKFETILIERIQVV